MRKYRKIITIIGIIGMLSAMPYIAKADGDPDADVPIDGGISILVAAGIGYGIKKNKERKKEHE